MQMVRQELQAKLGDKVKDLSGVKIFTTFDSVAQDAAEKAAVEGIPVLKKQRKLTDLETAIVVVDRFSGEVRAMVGGSEPQFRRLQPCYAGASFNWFSGEARDLSDRPEPAEAVPPQYGLPMRRLRCVSQTVRCGPRRTMTVATAKAVK